MTLNASAIEKALDVLANADALIVCARTGMGVIQVCQTSEGQTGSSDSIPE